MASIDRLGQREFSAAAAMSDQMLERRLDSARGLIAAKAPLAHRLAELRKIVDELDPSRLEEGHRRSRGRSGSVPRDGDDMAGYFERFPMLRNVSRRSCGRSPRVAWLWSGTTH